MPSDLGSSVHVCTSPFFNSLTQFAVTRDTAFLEKFQEESAAVKAMREGRTPADRFLDLVDRRIAPALAPFGFERRRSVLERDAGDVR